LNIKEALSDKNPSWVELKTREDILAIYLHGSFAQLDDKERITNDIDLLLVLKEGRFTNFASDKLLGFEHIRHLDIFDLYLTDPDHCFLARQILGISEENLLFKKENVEIPEGKEPFNFSKKMAEEFGNGLDYSNLFWDESSKTSKVKSFIKEIITRFSSEEIFKQIKSEWKSDMLSWQNQISTILGFWLFRANHSWYHFFENQKVWKGYQNLKYGDVK
jgi:predicted nucleotidyltransferase